MLRIADQGMISHVESRGAYMPWLTPLPDGSFIGSQHVGQQLGSDDNHIVVLRSTDGLSWTEQGSIHAGGTPTDGWAYRAPQISVVGDTTQLVMTCTRFETGDGKLFDPDSEALARPQMCLFWSDDGGVSWTPPQIVPVDLDPARYTWNSAGQLVQLLPDRWIWPLETWKPEGFEGPPDQRAWQIVSKDQGQTWTDLSVVADDPSGKILYWDQMNCQLADGRLYTLLWTHLYGTSQDICNHQVYSEDQGNTWTAPILTNLQGQVCTPIPLPDGRVAAIYNHRHEPQGVHVALSEDLTTFDTANELVVFDSGAEATLGTPDHDNFLAEHMLIAFGKPGGRRLDDGTLLTWFWCTVGGTTHTRWVRVEIVD